MRPPASETVQRSTVADVPAVKASTKHCWIVEAADGSVSGVTVPQSTGPDVAAEPPVLETAAGGDEPQAARRRNGRKRMGMGTRGPEQGCMRLRSASGIGAVIPSG